MKEEAVLCPLWTFLLGILYFKAKISMIQRVLIISVSFEDYGYSPISPIGTRSLSVTFNIKEANSKVAKCNFRKSNPNNYGLNKSIILDKQIP